MGSFNVNCFLTKQSIKRGNKVIIFPIEMIVQHYSDIQGTLMYKNIFDNEVIEINKMLHVGNIDGTHELTGFWDISGCMMTAEYDDYGTFKIDDTSANIEAMQIFFKKLYSNVFKIEKKDKILIDFDKWYNEKDLDNFENLIKLWDRLYSAMMDSVVFLGTVNNVSKLNIAVMCRCAFDYLLSKKLGKLNYKEYFKTALDERLKGYDDNLDREYFIYNRISLLSLDFSGLKYSNRVTYCYKLHHNKRTDIKNKLSNEIDDISFSDYFYSIVKEAYEFCYVLTQMYYLKVRIEPIMFVGQLKTGSDYADLISYVRNNMEN